MQPSFLPFESESAPLGQDEHAPVLLSYREISATLLRRVIQNALEDTEQKVENALTIYRPNGSKERKAPPYTFARWRKPMWGSKELIPEAVLEEEQKYYERLLNPGYATNEERNSSGMTKDEEREWDRQEDYGGMYH